MQFDHILSKHGVLTAFNIARKVKQSDIKKIRAELKKTCSNTDEIKEKLQQMILLKMRNTMHFDTIPGLIVNKTDHDGNVTSSRMRDPFKNIPDKLKQKIVGMSFATNKMLRKEKFNKELILIFLQILLMENKITNQDIIEFNKKYKLRPLSDDDYVNEDDEDNDDEDDDNLV